MCNKTTCNSTWERRYDCWRCVIEISSLNKWNMLWRFTVVVPGQNPCKDPAEILKKTYSIRILCQDLARSCQDPILYKILYFLRILKDPGKILTRPCRILTRSWQFWEVLGEREISVGIRGSVSTQFRVLPNFHECFYITYGNTGKDDFYFFYKITRRKLKRGNSLLYQRVNSPRTV